MRVDEILRIKGHTLFTTAPGGPAIDAVRAMAQHDIGSLVVMDRGRLVGMLTFREILDTLARRDGSLGELTVDAIYEREPLTAAPDLDVMELRRVMLEHFGYERYARQILASLDLGLGDAAAAAASLESYVVGHAIEGPKRIAFIGSPYFAKGLALLAAVTGFCVGCELYRLGARLRGVR